MRTWGLGPFLWKTLAAAAVAASLTAVPAAATAAALAPDRATITAVGMRPAVGPRLGGSLIEHWNGTSWTQVPSPSPGSVSNQFDGVAAASTYAWAVGTSSYGSVSRSLVAVWAGSTWTQVPSPDPGTLGNVLNAVTVISPTDAWAVGDWFNTGGFNGAGQPLIVHWNGTSWTQVTSPVGDAVLTGVTATSATDVWAVGWVFKGNTGQTLALHWNGTSWTQVPTPDPAGPDFPNSLSSVTATSSGDAWAAGSYFSGGVDKTLILRWNGTAWSQVTSPNPGPAGSDDSLGGIIAASTTNAWAVGYYGPGTTPQTLALHWNGTAWTQQASASPGGMAAENLLVGAAIAGTSAWAVGTYQAAGGGLVSLAERPSGNTWVQVPTVNPAGSGDVQFYAVSASSATNAWAVGSY